MATIKGTPGRDVYVLTTPDVYDALEGDDEVTIKVQWGTVQGGPGNDVIVVDPSIPALNATVWYWSSNRPILVDLGAGYALDGFGGRDTLINVRNVHGFKQPGDKALGSGDSDSFWVSPWRGQTQGLIEIDGRGGSDTVIISWHSSDTAYGALVLSVSPDMRMVRAWHEKSPGFVYEMRNVEIVQVYDNTSNQMTRLDLASHVSYANAGQQILLRGASGWQLGSPGTGLTVTYGFLTERPATGAEGGTGFVAFNAEQQAVVRAVFAKLSQQTGVVFSEVAGAQAQMRFGINQQADTRGYSFLPDAFRSDAKGGDVWLDVETAALLKPGQEGYFVLLHEIGHALGLQHPLGEADTSGATVLLDRLWNLATTIMIASPDDLATAGWPSWFGWMDINALRHLYGTKAYATEDSRYALAQLRDAGGVMSIADDGGVDWIDASASTVAVSIDLRPGHLSSIGSAADGAPLRGNVAIATGTWIENAEGSGGDDLIIGNELANTFRGNGGNDILDGLGGVDWAVFAGLRSAWDLETPWAATRFVTARDGISGATELRSIERVRFDDVTVAFDMGKGDSAGQAMLLIGSVIGREAMMSKPGLMGQVIGFFDQGFTITQLAGAVMRLPIWGGVLTPTDSAEDIARHLLKLSLGRDPTAAEVSAAARDISTQPQGAFLASLALTEGSAAQVNLVGLASTGFEYPNGG